MAKATGSIVVNSNPSANSKTITINDGQGGAFSEIIFSTIESSAGHPGSTPNQAPLVTLFGTSTTNSRPLMVVNFGGTSTTHSYNTFDDDWGLDGTRPAKLVISDTVGNTISVTFSTATSGTSGSSIFSGTNSNARKVSTGVYEVDAQNVAGGARLGSVMFGVFKCVQDAITNDSFDVSVDLIHYSNGSSGSSLSDGNISYPYLKLFSPNSTDLGPEHSGISVGLERASGTWSASSGTDFIAMGTGHTTGTRLSSLDGPNEAIYTSRTGPHDSFSSSDLTATELATSLRQRINASPIAITAAGSGTTVSLTNDAHGTAGNTTITTNDSTNFSVTGFTGGAAEGGGGGGGGSTAMRMTISAKQLALSSSGGIAAFTGSSDQPSLKMDISSLAALGASPASGDFIPVHDISTAGSVKKITVAELIGSVAAGSDTQVQFNDGGSSLGGDSGLTYNKTTDTLSVGNDLKLTSDSAILSLGAGDDATLTHDGTTGLTIAASPISIDSTGELHLNSTTGDIKFQDGGTDQLALDLDGTSGEIIMQLKVDSDDFVFKQYDGTEVFRVEDDGSFDIAGGAGSSGVTVSAAGQLTVDGRVLVDDATDATSTTDGSLQTDGGLSVVKDIIAGNDVKLLSDSAVLAMGAGSDVTLTHDGGTGATLASAGAFLIDGANAVSIDGASGVNIGTNDSGAAISIGHTTSEVTVNDNLTVTGDLTVNGTTTTIDTTNLLVEDPIVLLNKNNSSANGQGGIAIENGGSSADMVFGRVANDTWGVGTKDTSAGSVTTLADMTLGAFRAGKLEIDGANDYIDVDTDLKIIAAADVLVDPGGGELKVDGNIVPNSDSADSLGASGTAWANLYVDAIDLNGQGSISMGGTGRIDLDADDDTSIRASADDVITFEAGGVDSVAVKATGLHIVDDLAVYFGSGDDARIEYDEDGSDQLRIHQPAAGVVIAGTNPKLVLGDAGAEDTMLVFDGNAQDFRMGLDDGTDKLEIGVGSAHGTTTALTIDASQQVAVVATTAASSTSTGALTVAGGAAVAADLYVGDDLELASDAAKLGFGADSDVSLTHVADTGLLLNSSRQLQFGDSGTYIHQSADGVLDLVADTEIEINATTIDINGNVEMDSGLTVAGASVTFSALADLTNSNVASGDKFIIQDADASGVAKEITFDHVAEKMAGAGIANSSGVLSIAHQQDTYISGGGSSGNAGTVFTLTQTPASADAVSVYINGLLQARSGSAGGFQGERDYNISGTTLTLVSSNALASGDELVVRYIKT